MTLTELRAACERAGMTVRCTGPDPLAWWARHDKWEWWLVDPALPAYVASLLTAEVREIDEFMGDMEHRLLMEHPDQVLMAATDEQRIRAAMAVLSPAPPIGTGD